MEPLLIWVGVIAGLALAAAGVSLHLHRKGGSPIDLAHRVHTLELDLNELFDRVDHWQRRDRVRRIRAGAEPELQAPQPQPGTPEYKLALRNRLRNIKAGGTA